MGKRRSDEYGTVCYVRCRGPAGIRLPARMRSRRAKKEAERKRVAKERAEAESDLLAALSKKVMREVFGDDRTLMQHLLAML